MIRLLPGRRAGADGRGTNETAQVLAALGERRLRSRRARDRIPAYLVIGPRGMGKSTLIERSGLDHDQPLELASSTWWIGEDAFFVEVSEPPGLGGAHPVFPLLQSVRPLVPVSGVIMVLSPADLTLADPGERTDMGAAQTRFLREFERRFGYAPPLYVVVSKLDLTPGFAEFFDRLEPAEREQAWGFTLPTASGRPLSKPTTTRARPSTAAPPAKGTRGANLPAKIVDGDKPNGMSSAYTDGFRRLLNVIRARVTQWISHESDPVQCARIAGFGSQVAAIEAILRPIIEPLMPADTRRWAGAYVRGVYLTSAQQSALSIDPLLPDMAKRFGLPRTGTLPPDLARDDETQGYFVDGTFRRVILPEAGLMLLGNERVRRARTRGLLSAAAVIVVCVGLGLASAFSYRDGIAQIDAVNRAVAAIGPSLTANNPARVPAVLSSLDTLDSLRGTETTASPSTIVSLDSLARALIADNAGMLYPQAVKNSLVPHLSYRLASDLVRSDTPTDTLRAALAASNPANTAEAYDRWLQKDGAGLSPVLQTALSRHGAYAVRLAVVPVPARSYTAFAKETLLDRERAQ